MKEKDMKLTLLGERGKKPFAVMVDGSANSLGFAAAQWVSRTRAKHYKAWREARGLGDCPESAAEYANAVIEDDELEVTCLTLGRREALEGSCMLVAEKSFPGGLAGESCARLLDAKGNLVGYLSCAGEAE